MLTQRLQEWEQKFPRKTIVGEMVMQQQVRDFVIQRLFPQQAKVEAPPLLYPRSFFGCALRADD